MPEATTIDTITSIRTLLREGRTTEADKDLDTLAEKIRLEEERRKLEIPPPPPRTLANLTTDFFVAVAALLGNPPKLLALIVEIQGKYATEE